MSVHLPLTMDPRELLALVLAGLGLLLVATGFGAALMFRVVHLPGRPPALPIWVSSLLVVGGALLIVASVVAGHWLGVASAVLISITFVIQFVLSIRQRAADGR